MNHAVFPTGSSLETLPEQKTCAAGRGPRRPTERETPVSGDGRRQAERARACAGLVPPDDLVRVECDPDGSDERERDEGGDDNGYRKQQRAGDRGDQATAAERA
jgi:hypothetical protein